ncbi:MAG: hypothetical protein ACON5A_03440 [Candidatus Comchoanobacterales bacterium]
MSDLLTKLVNSPQSNEEENNIPSLSSSVTAARPQVSYARAVIIMSFLITISALVCCYVIMRPTQPSQNANIIATSNDVDDTIEIATPVASINSNEDATQNIIAEPIVVADINDDEFEDVLPNEPAEIDTIVLAERNTPNLLIKNNDQPTTQMPHPVAPPSPKEVAKQGTQVITRDTLDEMYGDIIHGQLYPAIVKMYAFPKSQKLETIDLTQKLITRLIKVKHVPEALTLADAALSIYPTAIPLVRTKAMVLVNQKQYAEAEMLLKNFTPSFDEHLSYYNILAFAELANNHNKDAIQIYRQLVDLKPQKVTYWTSLARAYEKSKNYHASLEAYRHAMKLIRPTSPNYEYIRNKQISLQHKIHV